LSIRQRVIYIAGGACLLSACASSQGPAFSYNEVVIVNQSRSPVSEVVISATTSGRMFSCGSIAPRGICSDRFPPQPYRGDPIRVDWVVGNRARRSETVELTLPESFVPDVPLRGVLVIGAQGDLSAYLQQDAPGPHL
jgi:hypothetical protein